MNNLIVKDEEKKGDYLKQSPAESSFVLDLVRSGSDGIHLGLTEYYDLVVLDVMVPGPDGCGVLRAIRAAGKKIWDMHFESDTNVIEVAVRRYLAKVDDDFEPNKLIITARGMGYVVEIPESA